MVLSNSLKKLISYFTPKPVQRGIGISFDTDVTLSKDTNIASLDSQAISRGIFYHLRSVEGLFELVGQVKSGDDCLYQIRHRYSGQTLNITKNMLDFLFEKHEP
jgi:hypothetical protein